MNRPAAPSRVLVTGATGLVGAAVVARARADGHEVLATSRTGPLGCDVTDRAAVRSLLVDTRPDLVVHAAAWTAVDACEGQPDRAVLVNGVGTANVCTGAAAVGAHVVVLSTDHVFDGTKPTPYVEHDRPSARSAYGRSKLAAETAARAVLDHQATVVRTSWVFGAHRPNLVHTILRLADERPDATLRFVVDQRGRPTPADDLAPVLLRLGLARPGGTWHAAGQGATTRAGFARAVLAAAGHDPDRVEPIATDELLPRPAAPRPANAELDDRALRATPLGGLPPWLPALGRLVDQLRDHHA